MSCSNCVLAINVVQATEQAAACPGSKQWALQMPFKL